MAIEVIEVDYTNQQQAEDLAALLNEYAKDPMGGNESLDPYVRENLAKELNKVPNAFSILCYVDKKPAAFANCFESFSTFKCKPLINIHDIAVKYDFRGKHLSQIILDKIEYIANRRQCCKITLEVLNGNAAAKKAYQKFGFEPYQLDGDTGNAEFWQKELVHK
ncbi:GNAT family N-acetyltransferase [Endozoicomonas euniceicola]|uniref:GNAT family N-acetyltransferase n=1 Tax=Endozoicomonas euniceicola TaxID=1234143 RepID=A0ABY6GZU4_9GAMM|nr:GNAT family N-acetyltransferase [Endozoicomonas euniceicola]UYM18323.1 GNAT family N-acetyltransferase [Endozoicomonas euniceicola]